MGNLFFICSGGFFCFLSVIIFFYAWYGYRDRIATAAKGRIIKGTLIGFRDSLDSTINYQTNTGERLPVFEITLNDERKEVASPFSVRSLSFTDILKEYELLYIDANPTICLINTPDIIWDYNSLIILGRKIFSIVSFVALLIGILFFIFASI